MISRPLNIKPIRTKRDYSHALKSVEALMSAETGTAHGDMLDILVTLIQAYEDKNFPVLPPVTTQPTPHTPKNC